MPSTESSLFLQVNELAGRVQEHQGNHGCWMELIRQARIYAGIYTTHSYMFRERGYEQAMNTIIDALADLPDMNDDALAQERLSKILAVIDVNSPECLLRMPQQQTIYESPLVETPAATSLVHA